MSEWQPIDTAQVEQNIIIGAWHEIPMHGNYWAWQVQGRFVEGEPRTEFWCALLDDVVNLSDHVSWNQATHWKPLDKTSPKEQS